MNMANLLIVDDDATIREVIAYTLRDCGFTFLHADDGNKAIELFEKEAVHAILTDSEVSGKDGLEILKTVRKSNKNIPVILMVGLGEENSDRYLDEGAFATLRKPFSIEDIKRVVNEAVPASVQSILEKSEKEKDKEKRRKRKQAVWLWSSGALLALAAAGTWRAFKPAPKTRAFPLTYSNVSGIAWDGKNLWTCDWLTESLYQHSGDSLGLIKKYPFEGPRSGLAWDGKNLWSVSAWSRKLTRHKAGADLKADSEIPVPLQQPAGFFIDSESNFWLSDLKEGKISKARIKGDSLETLWSGKAPAEKPVGTYREKEFLWTADARSGLLLKMRADNLETLDAYGLPPEVEKGKLSAFTSDGTYFWVAFEGVPRIYRVHAKRLIKVKK